jgi:outer membrane protein
MGRRPPEIPEVKEVPPTPLTLEDCYEFALKRSETVAIQKEEIEEAEAQFFKATSEALGDIDFVMTDFRQDAPKPREVDVEGRGGFGGTFNARHRRERAFVISQPLFQGFKSIGALSGAGSFRRQQREEWLRAKELLFLDVASVFYALLREKKDLENIEGIRLLLEERITELKAREAIGRSRPSEVVQAEAKWRRSEGEIARVHGVIEATRHLLEFLTGISMEPRQLKEEELPQARTEEIAAYLKDSEIRPDVEATRQAVKTARGALIVAQSALWPEITLENSQYVKREGFQKDFDWDLLIKVNVPLFRGGETIGKLKEARSRWKQTKLVYSRTRREAELEIKEAYEKWVASRRQSRALEKALRASQENYRLQKEDYARNLVGNLDVLEALEELFETSRAANRVHYEMKESYWRLQVATGEVV